MPVTLSSKSRSRSKKIERDQELIEKSLKRYKITSESESETRRQGLEDLKFSIGTGQWDESVKANREIDGKPCLTLNRAPSFLRQYTGEERQHRPAMLVDPVGSGADEEVADICQGVLRHIEVASFADVTYDSAYDMMLRIGWAYWRISNEYISETSFDQEPRIVPIENPFAVYMSPIRKPDGTDPLWSHVVQDLGKEEYLEKYGKSEFARLNFPTDFGNAEPSWVVKDGVRIAEYWWLELEGKELFQLDTGLLVLSDEFHGDKGMIVNRRDTVTRKVCCVKHNAIEVLERYDHPGRYIPLVEVNGVRLNINGQIYKAGPVRDYRDAQRIYDFMVTRAVEQIDLTGKDPLFVAEGSIAGHEEEYRQMNRKNYPYVYYKAVNESGQQLPPPTRANREPPIQAMHMMIQQADYDMKAVIGIYGTGPGETPIANESAFAVLTREQQQGTGAINWSDNLNHSIRYQGKILLDDFPKLIDAPRIQRIINPDDSVKHAVVINSRLGDNQQADGEKLLDQQALKKVYDLGTGDYDVTMSTGPAYRTARQEAFRALTAIVTAKPELFPIVGDIWVKYADWPGAHVLGERLKKMLPPNLQDQDDDSAEAKLTQAQATLQQLSTQHNQLVTELARATDTIRTKRLELESRERIAGFQAQAGMIEAMLKANFEAGKSAMEAELATIQHRMELLHQSMSVEQEAGAAPPTPELPSQVEPKVQPVTPAAPVAPVQPIPGAAG
jgi:hypothetical protein